MQYSNEDIALIINIPFDSALRRGERMRVPGVPAPVRERYLQALEAELLGAEDVLKGRRICSLSLRGSAAMLPPDGLSAMLRRVRSRYDFLPEGEFSIELTPRTIGTPALTSLNVCKFKRLCLDAYSMDPAVLDYLGADGLDVISGALRLIEKFGYTRLSLRCIYGVPGMNEAGLRRSLDLLTESQQVKEVELFPYGCAGEEGVSDAALAGQYEAALAFLKKRGFTPYGLGRLYRVDGRDGGFLAENSGVDFMGFGAGAVSCVDGMLYQNTADVSAYNGAMGDYTKLVAGAAALDARACRIRKILGALRLYEGAALADLGLEADEGLRGGLYGLARDSLLELQEGHIRATPLGCACFSRIEQRLLGL